MIHKQLPRRTFLRGLGTALALPALEAMLPSSVLAAPAKKSPPVRMAFIFVPNGKNMALWTPEKEGESFDLPYTLQPLAALKNDILVMSGLTHNGARALGDGAGDHARSTAAFLTGAHPKKTDGADIRNGISVDQFAAQQIGSKTRFPSLEIGCEPGRQAGNCDSGYSCAYSSTVSWQSDTTPVAKEVDPRLVFERFFTSGGAEESAEAQARRNRYRKSILDFVKEDASSLKAQLGLRDQRKLDEYFTGIRELENRLARIDGDAEISLSGLKKPAGIPADYSEHLKLMSDILVLAFQTDLTRISTFMFANDGSNRPYRSIEIPEGHHDLSHHQNDPEKLKKIGEINRFHVRHLAYLLQKLKSTEDAYGPLLDNTMVVYGCGISDGNRHNHENLPVLFAGRGGGTIRTGRHIKYPVETPMSNLFLSMLDRMKVDCVSLGDSKGRLDKLT